MRTDAANTRIAQDLSQLCSLVFRESRETGIGVTHRRAQFDGLKAGFGKLPDGAGKVPGHHLPDRPSLTSKRQVERIGAKFKFACRQKPCRSSARSGNS